MSVVSYSFYNPDDADDDAAIAMRSEMGARNLATPNAPFLTKLWFTLTYILRGGHKPTEKRKEE